MNLNRIIPLTMKFIKYITLYLLDLYNKYKCHNLKFITFTYAQYPPLQTDMFTNAKKGHPLREIKLNIKLNQNFNNKV